MRVDQTRREIRALEVDNIFRVVIAKTDDAAIVDRHIGGMNLPTEDIDELGVSEKQPSRRLAPGDAELVLDFPHDKTRSAMGCSGVASGDSGKVRP